MKRLKEILEILLKYTENGDTSAEHDTIYFYGIEPEKLSQEDAKRLEDLGCYYDESLPSWIAYT